MLNTFILYVEIQKNIFTYEPEVMQAEVKILKCIFEVIIWFTQETEFESFILVILIEWTGSVENRNMNEYWAYANQNLDISLSCLRVKKLGRLGYKSFDISNRGFWALMNKFR